MAIAFLLRIRAPPQGGAKDDYLACALAQPGMTRAWVPAGARCGHVDLAFAMGWSIADHPGSAGRAGDEKRSATQSMRCCYATHGRVARHGSTG
jgi:uncharacterized phage protein gp47/JayE